jgi:hypothetical protein
MTDILKEEFPEFSSLLELDRYVRAVLKLHADAELPEFFEDYKSAAEMVNDNHPNIAEFLIMAEKKWSELEKNQFFMK